MLIKNPLIINLLSDKTLKSSIITLADNDEIAKGEGKNV